MSMNLLSDLNPSQKAAVTHTGGPLLIVAGAGTGKTTVITRRFAWLAAQNLAAQDHILTLTFTEKAAGEMEERIDQLVPLSSTERWVMTFHAFCERVLRAHALDLGLPGDFKILDSTGQWLLLRRNLDKFSLDYYKPLGNPAKFLKVLLDHFSRLHDEAIGPAEYLDYVQGQMLNKDTLTHSLSLGERVSPVGDVGTSGEGAQELARMKEIAEAYHTYQQIKLDEGWFDFGDLMMYTYELFKRRPAVLALWRAQFPYVLVDEFQDTNWVQYEVMKMLGAPGNNITVVGDDEQCLPGSAVIDVRDGKKIIKDVVIGDEVLTAVGKGHVGVSRVTRVMRTTKDVRLLRITTKRGHTITVTDNHKMFCFVPRTSDKKYYYVYVMYRQNFGWRMGITDDLALRLRIERSADTILGLKACNTESEARFYETLWSLRYGIPTVCFMERPGAMMRGTWLHRLYRAIDTQQNIERLAKDLHIDINSFHYCLDAVQRGSASRIVIHFEVCHRAYRSKDHVRRKKKLLLHPSILHSVSLETSDRDIIAKLKKHDFSLSHGRHHGMRLRIASTDIVTLGTLARQLQKITGGFLVYGFKVGTVNYQHRAAYVMPAKNLLRGHYVPVRIGKDIIYDQIIRIKERVSKETVYDLEVARTHNFIADSVVVHNSIYAFRGASMSNILHFKDDYPTSSQVVLTQNYRSFQGILDKAYSFIQANNPNRLEYTLKIPKKLKAVRQGTASITHLHASSLAEEMQLVTDTIIKLRHDDPTLRWGDIAILARANNHIESAILTFDRAGIPYRFLASSGLYAKPLVLDIIAYLKLLDNYHESASLYRVLTMPALHMPYEDISLLTHYAKRKGISLYSALKQASLVGVSLLAHSKVAHILHCIATHSALAQQGHLSFASQNLGGQGRVGALIFKFLEEFEVLKRISSAAEGGSIPAILSLSALQQFLKKVEEREISEPHTSVHTFIETLDLLLQAGDEGSMTPLSQEEPDAVHLMTVHGAKGLEFRYVVIINMVDLRFPSLERKEPLPIPDALVKEVVPQGDTHLEEERRLMYVAMTRARDGLFFTSADDYGGLRKKKLSRFLMEMGFAKPEISEPTGKVMFGDTHAVIPTKVGIQVNLDSGVRRNDIKLPASFSFTQLKAFENCPLQYKFAHILMVPVAGKPSFSFGKSIHATLEKFLKEHIEAASLQQQSLFTGRENKDSFPSLKHLLDLYEQCWISDWYEDEKQQAAHKDKGKKMLTTWYERLEGHFPPVAMCEAPFKIKVGPYTMKGVIDRIDKGPDGKVTIIDYKTGTTPNEREVDKDQLLLYHMAADQVWGFVPVSLEYHFLESATKIAFTGTEKDIAKVKEKMSTTIDAIQTSDFHATPSAFTCRSCDFNSICEYRIL